MSYGKKFGQYYFVLIAIIVVTALWTNRDAPLLQCGPGQDAGPCPTIDGSPASHDALVPSDSSFDATVLLDTSNGPGRSHVFIENQTAQPTVAHFAFGADSTIQGWSFCNTEPSGCFITVPKHSATELPLSGNYLNVTVSFDAPVGCGVTKAEVNTNNPKWYSIADVSLVDGYSNRVQISFQTNSISDAAPPADAAILGPPNGRHDNENVLGLFPYGCDICVARNQPPCGITAGGSGCKAGTQYNPTPVCQFQGSVMGGGETIRVQLVP